MNIKLHKLCITASTLNQVIRHKSSDDFEKVLYEQCISIIRRMYDKNSFKNEAVLHGQKYEKLLIENKYFDPERFLVQEQFEKDVMIEGMNIPFRATLDVHDTLNDEILEIKCPFYKAITLSNAQEYANNYNTQLQVQLLCSGIKTAKVVIYWEGKLFECKSVTLDNTFISKNKTIIKKFWKKLNEVHAKYIAKETKVVHEVEKYEESPLNRDLELMSDIAGYSELSQMIEQKNQELLQLKEKIVNKIDNYGIDKFSTPFLTISRTTGSYRCDYQKILKDKYGFNLETDITDDERKIFMKKTSGSWAFRLKQA
jgi:hypothetical protein